MWLTVGICMHMVHFIHNGCICKNCKFSGGSCNASIANARLDWSNVMCSQGEWENFEK